MNITAAGVTLTPGRALKARCTQEEQLRRKVGGQELAPGDLRWRFSLMGNHGQLSQRIKRPPSCCRLDEGREVGGESVEKSGAKLEAQRGSREVRKP